MLTTTQASPRGIAPSWALMIAAACGVYFAGVAHESIWYDESVSIAIAQLNIGDIIRAMPVENHPPLHFLLLHLVYKVFGNSEWAMRLPSVLGAIGLVGLGAGPVRRIMGNRLALVYAGVVLFMPVVLINAHEARMYSLATFAVTATVVYGFAAVRFGQAWDWAWFGLATLLAAYLHYYGLIAGAVTQAFIGGWSIMRGREQGRRWLLNAGLTLLGYLPWLVILAKQTERVNRSGFWVPPISLIAVGTALLKPFTYRELGPTLPVIRPWMAVAFTLSITFCIMGVVLARRNRAQLEQAFGLTLLSVFLGTLSVAIAISLVSVPIFYSRYLVVCAGLLALSVSLGIGQLPQRRLAVAFATLSILNALSLKDVYTHHFNPPFKRLQLALSTEIQPSDLIVTSDCFTVGPSLLYFPRAVTYYASNSFESARDGILKVANPQLRYNSGLKDQLATRQSFWSITDTTGLGREVEDLLADTPGWEAEGPPRLFADPPPYSSVRLSVTRYVHSGGRGPLPGHGRLEIHASGLRLRGTLMVLLLDRFPPDASPPVRAQMLKVQTTTIDTKIYGVPYGDYVLLLLHDENSNFMLDFRNGAPAEGTWIANGDKVDPRLGLKGFVFDVLKFPFRETDRRFDVPMQYPSF